MNRINLNLDFLLDYVSKEEIDEYKLLSTLALDKLLSSTGKGSDFTGWVKYPVEIDPSLVHDITCLSKDIRKNSKALVVIGIGGSYLGSKACIEMFKPYYSKKDDFEVIFLGNDMSPSHIKETLDYLKDIDFTVNVISKSGKTLEPALAFRFVKELMITKYGNAYSSRVIVTTSSHNSIILDEAKLKGYKTYFIPDNIGGRFSIFTPCGLIPIACYGIDINEILDGFKSAYLDFTKNEFDDNNVLKYAVIRNILYKKGLTVEIQASFEVRLRFFGEWWKQLFGESEGKEHKGILPYSVTYSTDLHSLGQYVQDGLRNIFELFIDFDHEDEDVVIKENKENLDFLNYLSGKDVTFVRKQALLGVAKAHHDGGVPVIIMRLDKMNYFNFGYLIYFFMLSCGVSGYLLDVNPFNQEGVEAYKKNMQALLKK